MLSPFSSVVFIKYKHWFIISQVISTFLIIPHIQSQFKILVFLSYSLFSFQSRRAINKNSEQKYRSGKYKKHNFKIFFLNSYKTNFLDYWNDFSWNRKIITIILKWFFKTQNNILIPIFLDQLLSSIAKSHSPRIRMA